MNLIELKDVNFSYNGEPVLVNISVAIEKGEYAGILGPNGGGKTTFVKVILGLLRPTSGHITLFGQDTNIFRDWSKIGYVPQRATQINIHFPITVEEVVGQGRIARRGMLRKFSQTDVGAINKALNISGIEHLKHRLIADLSGGERQRVFIARTLASEPELLILDEPAVGVDLPSQENFYQFLKDLNIRLGLTILFVSHDIDVLANQASCLICLNRGLVYHGTPREIFKEGQLEKVYGKNVKFILHGH
ncbi:metal ABC transporter ATP-binding protein [Candidatus Hakubella thermalkaliphila]|uniref:Zinc transport system ATP-binding protein n=1 Tax=Candidatus Hakubella thermalkaliphila TaxID=2754717 RepID=A0A6V8P6A2_9ACTN|nr:metal ABC transporter ATP-binding protein [Candidatus Hakubella thermalkaliphila]GFP27164.1 zinc transport system ATP-binding protein [Candidatus Hakubella thermalkaliphila]